MTTLFKTSFAIILSLLAMDHTRAQITDLLDPGGDGINGGYFGELVECRSGNKDKLAYIDYAYISSPEAGTIRCSLYLKGSNNGRADSQDWHFRVGPLEHRDGVWSATLYDIALTANNWFYSDDKATGTYTYSETDRTETLRITFRVHNHTDEETLSWKLPRYELQGRVFIAEEAPESGSGSFREMRFGAERVTVREYSEDANGNLDVSLAGEFPWRHTGPGRMEIEGYDGCQWFNVFDTRLRGLIRGPRGSARRDIWFEEIIQK
ncbi:MAG: hypothetical protein LUF87_08120 [Alistipes sp.]|nr:hypothetical protein [Alistipes sp.]